MKHGNSLRKFGRGKNQRKALLSGLARSLILKEKIKTTEARAKSLRPFVEKMITKGKKGGLSDQRIISSKIDSESAKKIIDKLSPRFMERKGGYLRITKSTGKDGKKEAIIEFLK